MVLPLLPMASHDLSDSCFHRAMTRQAKQWTSRKQRLRSWAEGSDLFHEVNVESSKTIHSH